MSLSGSLAFLEAESFYSSTWGGGESLWSVLLLVLSSQLPGEQASWPLTTI